ncbi:unnamed protein product [Rotaria sp. Silwood2]|nr:unnamed protein product [Rotaria sp. Silwood2]CAF2858149.1 unnamed protein product [Rotaria sp. Silwood2]CAF3227366.1 unnamed protein product [Rotaria sp. Silwood2]CAF4045399.1 unnamed protein product [Rotaria sp. Silwood2]CAF4060766.1 unnamed protein product [Rotaria sp. Silwood2]
MAKIYEKLQNSLISYEDWPKAMVTEQTFSKAAHIIRGQDRGRAVWYYILVPVNNIVDLKAKLINTTIHVTDFGLVIKYLNNRDEIKQMSGTGTDPPVIIQRWVAKHYSSPAAADENTNLKYIKDDIRLCTIQRAIPQQLIGVHFHYFAPQRFHYMKLIDDLPSSLAHRAGLKSYDRIIFFNDKNIENETDEQFRHRFNTERHLPVQMLVCSPATYAHYKANKKIFHCNLRTIRYLKPVYATSTSDSYADTPAIYVDKESFCAVQWENSNIVSTVSQSAIFKSPEFTNFPSLRHVNLCRIDESDCHPWTMSPSLQFVSVLSCKPATIPIILASCPNLYHLQVHLSRTNNNNATLYIPLNHPLRRLTLWSDYTELTFNIIDNIVTYTPNIEYLYLQTIYRMSFVDLARNLFNRLHRLSQFGCYIQEMLTENDRTTDLTTLHQVHSCFERIQCIEENDEFRIFATK